MPRTPHVSLAEAAPKDAAEVKRRIGRSVASARSHAAYLRIWNRFLAAHPTATVEGVTTRTIDRYLTGLENAGGKARYVNTTRAALRTLFAMLIREGVRHAANPVDATEAVPVPRREVRTISSAQFDAMLATTEDARERAVLLLMGHGGLRIHEVCFASWVDLYEDHLRLIGKGDKERIVPFSPALAEAMRIWSAELEASTRNASTRWLFPSPQTRGRELSESWIRLMVRRCAAQAGVTAEGREVHPHMLRRCCAMTLLNECDAPIDVVAKVLGHRNVTTTMLYAEASASRAAAAVGRMGRAPVEHSTRPKEG